MYAKVKEYEEIETFDKNKNVLLNEAGEEALKQRKNPRP